MNIEKQWLKSYPNPLLMVLSKAYGIVICARNFFYKKKLFHVHMTKSFIISVGNITVGGTGKTPFTIYLCEILKDLGLNPAVVSRGYGRRNMNIDRLISDHNRIIQENPDITGDEPLLIARKLPGVPVVVAKKRFQGVKILEACPPVSVIVMDDGFQHRNMHRNIDILLLDAKKPFGNGWLLPAGPLREPPSAIKRSHIIVLTQWTGTQQEINQRLALQDQFKSIPILTATLSPVEMVDTLNQTYTLDKIKDRHCLAFSGIGQHLSFILQLKNIGTTITHEINFKDHQKYTASVVDAIIQKATEKGAEMVITTEKDMVKIVDLWPKEAPLLLALRVGIRLNEESVLKEMLRRAVFN